MTQISFDAKQTNSLPLSCSITIPRPVKFVNFNIFCPLITKLNLELNLKKFELTSVEQMKLQSIMNVNICSITCTENIT